ncbi:acylneuraminate cytidylyltransferase [Candidatus Kaiserbacteria bacterium]|nr:acylneuraminate cytidylyltransferase [Candidatus Kaiserbacteria bacterium]
MSRRLVAALACRNTGSRLYGKPLQKINDRDTILDQIVHAVRRFPIIDEIVLGISEGVANLPFVDVAHGHGVSYVLGDPQDVLKRLIQCGRAGRATDVFRVTTECPWFAYDMLPDLWRAHVENGNDITVCDQLPEGLHFEIYTLDALERAHERGSSKDRSEFCSNYPRTHPEEFKAQVYLPPKSWRRMDLRVTVDYPEDLIIAREIAREFADKMPLVGTDDIVAFLGCRADLRALANPYVDPSPLWSIFPQQLEWARHA